MEKDGHVDELAVGEEPRIACSKWALARKVSAGVRQCGCRSLELPSEVHFLWIYLDRENAPGIQTVPVSMPNPLGLAEWQGVLDEAAGMGVSDVTFSVGDSPQLHPHLWELALYAQETYSMMVGIHLTGPTLALADVAALKSLDPECTRLFAKADLVVKLRLALGAQWKVYPSDFTPAREAHESCHLPKDMVFVNADGVMYTCGFVHGDAEYHMGNVYDAPMERKLNNPECRRQVDTPIPAHQGGCDGCPPLIAQAIARGDF